MGDLYLHSEHYLQILIQIGLRRYDRIVNRIYNNPIQAQKAQAMCILGWAVCAKRPLEIHEIQGGVSIDLEGKTVDFDGRRLRDDVRDLCGCLVDVQDGKLQLVHTTAK